MTFKNLFRNVFVTILLAQQVQAGLALTTVIDPLGNTTQRTYDLNRNLKTITDAEAHTTEYFYDPTNQLTQTLNADGGTIDYTYTLLGKVEMITDPNGNTTNFGYDAIGRLTSETDPKSYVTTYEYDKNHNLIEKTTPNAHTLTYSYDKLNRLTTKATPDQTYAFTYDSLSRLMGATNAATSLSFLYDAVGQLIQSSLVASDSSLVNISYSYDGAGRKISMTDPTGQTEYGHDKANRLTSIDVIASEQSESGNLSFNITYDKAGRRTLLTGPGGLERSYDYDDANRLLELINKVNGAEIAPFNYEYDKVGNRTSLTDKFGEHIANYDAVYRLLSLSNIILPSSVIPTPSEVEGEESNPITETFSYDKTGNRLSDITQTYEPNALNQITSGSSGLSLSYDANGNVTSKTADGMTWTYSWNSEGQLIQATSDESQATVSYQYDALGRRISKTLTTQDSQLTTAWFYDDEDILLEYENGVLTSRYTHGSLIDEPLAKTTLTTSQNYFYHADALGSITTITDSTGSVVESYRYSSYGISTIYDKDGLEVSESGVGNFYLHSGREYDVEIGAYYHRERYRFADLGAWLSKDPTGFEPGVNLYEYTGSNPINWTDPYGLMKSADNPYKQPPQKAPRYENWGGDDWSGGQRPSKYEGRAGTHGPADSMDELFMEHDEAYEQSDIGRATPNRDCYKISAPCEKEKCRQKNKADRRFRKGLKELPEDPKDWPRPPRNVGKAKRYRWGTEKFFPWP